MATVLAILFWKNAVVHVFFFETKFLEITTAHLESYANPTSGDRKSFQTTCSIHERVEHF